MATVTVLRVTEGWPKGDTEEQEPDHTTIDLEVSGKYVRWGVEINEVSSAADVQSVIEGDANEVLDFANNGSRDEAFPVPPRGTDRPDWIPDPFGI